ncbi:hypothetical protein YC2023_090093 [Brassica napus]
MEEELRDMKAHKDYYNMFHAVSDAQQGIPQFCPCGALTKEVVDEDDTYDYLPGKRCFICCEFENDGMHFRQPWVTGMQQEVESQDKSLFGSKTEGLVPRPNSSRDYDELKRQVKSLKHETALFKLKIKSLRLRPAEIDSQFAGGHPPSLPTTTTMQFFQDSSSEQRMVKEENSIRNMFCGIDDQSGFWPWLDQQHYN